MQRRYELIDLCMLHNEQALCFVSPLFFNFSVSPHSVFDKHTVQGKLRFSLITAKLKKSLEKVVKI